MSDKETSWRAVWDQLAKHNPMFYEREETGLECVLLEIQRLQALDARLEDYGPVVDESAPISQEAWDFLRSG